MTIAAQTLATPAEVCITIPPAKSSVPVNVSVFKDFHVQAKFLPIFPKKPSPLLFRLKIVKEIKNMHQNIQF